MGSSALTELSLLNGSLAIEVEDGLVPDIQSWLPLRVDEPRQEGSALISIRSTSQLSRNTQNEAPTFALRHARAWVHGDIAQIRAPDCECNVALGQRRADVSAHVGSSNNLFSLMTATAALLLGRTGRSLTHAGAVVHPRSHGAWLVLGDTHAGKTTTCITTVTNGWGYLSDDQVVIADDDVIGWPRAMHVDPGWHDGKPSDRRDTVLPTHEPVTAAPIAGLLFPRVEPMAATTVRRITPADALARLIRQTPWLMADRAVAARQLKMLEATSQKPAYELRLALDSYRDHSILMDVLSGL